MSLVTRRRLWFLAICAGSLAAMDARAQTSMHVTPVETALLPRFCWAQLEVPNATGDEFRIRDCGPAANHYCGGLINIMRAKRATNKSTRLGLINLADADVRYTEKAIADYPKCSIRVDVASTRAEVNSLMAMYGLKRPKAQ